jgi:hypothetical protein
MMWVVGVLAAALIVGAYFSRVSTRVDVVASTLILKAVASSSTRRFHWGGLQHVSSLVAILCALGCVLIVSGNGCRMTHSVVLVVDTSASMNRAGRWEKVNERVEGIVAETDGPVLLLGAGDEVRVLAGWTQDDSVAGAVLNRVHPGGTGKGLQAGLSLAEKLSEGRIVVITDKPPLENTGSAAEWITLGEASENLAITRAFAERQDSLGRFKVHVEVMNGGQRNNAGVLQMYSDGKRVSGKEVALASAAFASFEWEGIAQTGKELSIRLEGAVADGWSDDDVATLSLPPVQKLRVHLAAVDKFWSTAFEVHPWVELVSSDQTVDLLVLGSGARSPWPEARSTLLVGAGVSQVSGRDSVAGAPDWHWIDASHPLMEHVRLERVLARGVRVIENWPNSIPLVSSQAGAAVSVGEWRGQPAIAWGIEPTQSDLALRATFVNWVANVVDWAVTTDRVVYDETGANPNSRMESTLGFSGKPASISSNSYPWWRWRFWLGLAVSFLLLETSGWFWLLPVGAKDP